MLSRILFDLFPFWILRKSLLVHNNLFPHQVGSAWTETQLTNVLGGDHWSMSSPKITKLTMGLDKGHWKIQISFMIMMTCHLQNSWLSDALTTQPTVCPLALALALACVRTMSPIWDEIFDQKGKTTNKKIPQSCTVMR